MTLEGGTPFELEITPDPTPEERAAIEAALEAMSEPDGTGSGAWWEAGLLESVEEQAL